MRIVAGRWKGRRIQAPPGQRLRPTADRVREAWMSIVQPLLPGARVLDLFAGSGALGLEALSRGASVAEFVEASARHIAILRKNIDTLGGGDGAVVHRGDAIRFVQRLPVAAFDVAFADPPYDEGLATQIAEQWLSSPFARLAGIEHRVSEQLPSGGEPHRYGSTIVTIYHAR